MGQDHPAPVAAGVGAATAGTAGGGMHAPGAIEGTTQGAHGITQGHEGVHDAMTAGAEGGMNRAAAPGGMEGSPLVMIIKAVLAALGGGGRPMG